MRVPALNRRHATTMLAILVALNAIRADGFLAKAHMDAKSKTTLSAGADPCRRASQRASIARLRRSTSYHRKGD